MPAFAAGTGTISGTVTDQHGGPAQGVSVRAGLVTGTVDGPIVSTGADGRYELTGVPDGTFHVAFATMQAGQLKGSYYANALTREDATPVTVVGGGATTGIDQVVDLGASIAGTVTGPGGEALAGIQVGAYGQYYDGGTWNQQQSVITKADGTYVLTGLPAGTFRLGFRDPSGNHAEEFYDDAATVGAASNVVLGAGSRITGRDARLAPASHIGGKVTGPDGEPISGVSVQAYQKLQGQNYWAMATMSVPTQADGTYDIGGLRNGAYRIGFSSYNNGYISEYWNDAETVETATDVVVGEAATVPTATPSSPRSHASRVG